MSGKSTKTAPIKATKPAPTKPEATKPAETKPAEVAKPVEVPPVEAAKPVENDNNAKREINSYTAFTPQELLTILRKERAKCFRIKNTGTVSKFPVSFYNTRIWDSENGCERPFKVDFDDFTFNRNLLQAKAKDDDKDDNKSNERKENKYIYRTAIEEFGCLKELYELLDELLEEIYEANKFSANNMSGIKNHTREHKLKIHPLISRFYPHDHKDPLLAGTQKAHPDAKMSIDLNKYSQECKNPKYRGLPKSNIQDVTRRRVQKVNGKNKVTYESAKIDGKVLDKDTITKFIRKGAVIEKQGTLLPSLKSSSQGLSLEMLLTNAVVRPSNEPEDNQLDRAEEVNDAEAAEIEREMAEREKMENGGITKVANTELNTEQSSEEENSDDENIRNA